MASVFQSSGNTISARPPQCEHYYQIPADAEVKSVPISSLPPAIQQKIQCLDGCNDITRTSSVIYVSPVTKNIFPVGCKPSRVIGEGATTQSPMVQTQNLVSPSRPNTKSMEGNRDPMVCFVPIKTSKETASTILKLLETSNEKRNLQYVENSLPKCSDFLGFNLKVIGIKANALCMSKNKMYLMPEPRAKDSNAETEDQELITRSPGETTSRPETMKDTSNIREEGIIIKDSGFEIKELGPTSDTWVQQDDLGNMTADSSSMSQQQLRSRNGSNCWDIGDEASVKQPAEASWDLPEAIDPTEPNTSLRSPQHLRLSVTKEQIPLRIKQLKRKLSTLDIVKNLKKKNTLDGSETKQDTETVYTFSVTSSSPTSSASPPVEPLSCPPLPFLPWEESTRTDHLSLHNPLCSLSPSRMPSPSGETNTGEVISPSLHNEETSSSSFSSLTSVSSPTSSSEFSQCHSIPSIERSPTELPSFSELDETTMDERARRLEERVRELNMVVEDMRKSKKD
ncbi:uncharacterized protein LOC142140645 [Mixophyes fleayi]|uniref:uncharacterized protein LOC142140645 n=1 Tax=Mixophyes fleayi TaxID=3061075 RepID=UPI003F4E3BA6